MTKILVDHDQLSILHAALSRVVYEYFVGLTHEEHAAHKQIGEELAQPQSSPALSQVTGKKIGCIGHDCDECKAREAQSSDEPVHYEYRWLNPADQKHQADEQEWKRVEPNTFGTIADKVQELENYRYSGKPVYEVRCLYSNPQRREWVGLSDVEIDAAHDTARATFKRSQMQIRGQQLTASDDPDWHFAKAIEAALKEKNGGQ